MRNSNIHKKNLQDLLMLVLCKRMSNLIGNLSFNNKEYKKNDYQQSSFACFSMVLIVLYFQGTPGLDQMSS